jgi:hypothetical protein
MGFRSVATFACDLCHTGSEPIEVLADVMQAIAPNGWLRVQMDGAQGELRVMEVKYVCNVCTPALRRLFERARADA